MSFIFLWKPSVMPLFLVKRHMVTKASFQLWKVSSHWRPGVLYAMRKSLRTWEGGKRVKAESSAVSMAGWQADYVGSFSERGGFAEDREGTREACG